MFIDENIFIFDYAFDHEKLIDEFNKSCNNFRSYSDPRGKLDNFQIARCIEFEYADDLCRLFDINGKPRFFKLTANSVLPPHTDLGTLCSLNILLNSSSPAPVQFEDNSYYYKSCLLNTQNMHGVVSNSEDRLLFKLSIFDESYETVVEKIKKVIQ